MLVEILPAYGPSIRERVQRGGFGRRTSRSRPGDDIIGGSGSVERQLVELRIQFAERVTTVIIQEASHALFPEQPGAIADAVLPWAAHYA